MIIVFVPMGEVRNKKEYGQIHPGTKVMGNTIMERVISELGVKRREVWRSFQAVVVT